MYPVRSYANLDDRVSHEGESAYRVGREISKARAFSNFCRWNGKKKEKNKTRVRAHTNLQISKGKSTMGSFFFFLNFTSNDDQIRKTFLFFRSRSKGRNLASILTRSLFGSSKLVFDLFHLSYARVHVSIGWIAGGLLFRASMEARKMEGKVHVVLARVLIKT